MSLKDIITKDITDLRAQAAQLRTDADTKAKAIKARATSLESKLTTMPQELEALAEAEATKVWNWLKGG